MDIITEDEKQTVINSSKLMAKYQEPIDRESAYEILIKKLDAATLEKEIEKDEKTNKSEKSIFEKVANNSLTKIILREITRGILGVLGLSGTRSRSKKGFFS